jgi:uncharacterized protein with PQ loop repeat
MAENTFEIIVGTLLLVGILASFTPQYYRIVKKQSSEGLSAWFLFIGSAGSYAALSNAMIFYWPTFQECSDFSRKKCYHEILGFIQLAMLWLAFYALFLLFIRYLRKPNLLYRPFYDDQESETDSEPDNLFGDIPHEHRNDYHYCIRLFKISIVWIILATIVNIGLIYHDPESDYATGYAQALGGISLITGFLQYIPQIRKTYLSRVIGSLSIHSLFIQVPGSYLWVYFLISQSSADYTTWIPFLSAAMLQTVLLGICLWIKKYYKDNNKLREAYVQKIANEF